MASNFIVVFLTLFSVSLGDDIFNFGRGAGIPSNAMPAGAAGSNAAFDPSNFPAQPSPNPKFNFVFNQPTLVPNFIMGQSVSSSQSTQATPTTTLATTTLPATTTATSTSNDPKIIIPQQLNQLQIALTSLEAIRQFMLQTANSLSQQLSSCSNGNCDLNRWKRCVCITPATYDNEGRGNCNLGAIKLDPQVWCYVDLRFGDPRNVCPDAQPSPTKPGLFWSRIACIV